MPKSRTEVRRLLGDFRHLETHPLRYAGDCRLLGVSGAGAIYVEELYGAADWLAQHRLALGAGIVESRDERGGAAPDIRLLPLPPGLITGEGAARFSHLNFAGARRRGMSESERIADLVQGISLAEKSALVDFMGWDLPPGQLLGIAESRILAATRLAGDAYAVCRRIRAARRLPAVQRDGRGCAYDYDTLTACVLHELAGDADCLPALADCLGDWDAGVLLRPLDCLHHKGRLYAADGGAGDECAAVHIFERGKPDA